jgi:hypothetical protein
MVIWCIKNAETPVPNGQKIPKRFCCFQIDKSSMNIIKKALNAPF